MIQKFKDMLLGNNSAANHYYDNASSVSDWSWTTNTTTAPQSGMQLQQAYQQQLQQWKYMQQMQQYRYMAPDPKSEAKEADKNLLLQVHRRGEFYAARVLAEVGCA